MVERPPSKREVLSSILSEGYIRQKLNIAVPKSVRRYYYVITNMVYFSFDLQTIRITRIVRYRKSSNVVVSIKIEYNP